MAQKPPLLNRITLGGLKLAPSQVWGSVRLVPVLRPEVRGDLRLTRRVYGEDLSIVHLEGRPEDGGTAYFGYIPHGLIVSWTSDGSPVAARGSQLIDRKDGDTRNLGPFTVRLMQRMAKREEGNRLRLLPLDLSMEGYLGLHFRGPDIAWSEYSRQALSHGLSPRIEAVMPGRWVEGLEAALRVFEIHEEQVGVLVFVADALASAFVTPHPEDYRALHRTLIEDFYGELIYQYGTLYRSTGRMEATIPDEGVSTLKDLRAAVEALRAGWGSFHQSMAQGIVDRAVAAERVYRAGPFQLQRFMTDLDPSGENHIGEAITRDDGTLEYLKTFRLSSAQTKRAYLLKQLAEANWNLDAAAAALRTQRPDLLLRLEKAGFGYLLHQHVMDAARKARRGKPQTRL